jgi:6-pyruvoyltetrahydropterin/6-carboxytetrahydropterin synthase
MGHRLTKHQGKCWSPHGHSYRAIFTVQSNVTNNNGMVIDFYEFKGIKEWIDENLDHAMMLNNDDPLAVDLQQYGPLNNRNFKLFTIEEDPTAENIAKLLYSILETSIPTSDPPMEIKIMKVEVFETATCSAVYEPS